MEEAQVKGESESEEEMAHSIYAAGEWQVKLSVDGT